MIRKVLSLDSQMRKKKFSKKITALAVSVVLGTMICMPVFADGIDPDPCRICGDGSIWVSTELRNSYETGEERKCTHHKYGTDLEIMNHYIIYNDCIDCGYGWSYDTYSTSWECHGYDGSYRD